MGRNEERSDMSEVPMAGAAAGRETCAVVCFPKLEEGCALQIVTCHMAKSKIRGFTAVNFRGHNVKPHCISLGRKVSCQRLLYVLDDKDSTL